MAHTSKKQARLRAQRILEPCSSSAWHCLSNSPEETDRLGRSLGRALQGGETLALYGELGSGKTALVRGIATGLGASPRCVGSPTFVFIHEYRGRLRLAHVDLYRLRSQDELEHTGLSDYIDGCTVLAVEWAEKAGSALPADRLDIHVRHCRLQAREIVFVARGLRACRLLDRVRSRQDLVGASPRRRRG